MIVLLGMGVKTKVLVTGTGGTGVGASVISALYQPGVRDRWKIVAADANSFSWGLYAADCGVLVPSVKYRDQNNAYLDRIRKLITEHDVAAVIPGTEGEVSLLATRCDELPVPVIINDARLLPLMQDKRMAQEKLAELGLPHIKSYPWSERNLAVKDFGFPLVVKPMRNTSGSRGLHLVTSQAELDAIDLAIPPLDYDAYLPEVQPYLGDSRSEYTVGVLSRKDGTIIDSIVIRRELTGFSLHTEKVFDGKKIAVSTGFSQGYIIHHALIQNFCEQLAMKLGSCGPLNIQLRMHQSTIYVFEIHPRFSFSTAIRASAGFNEPDVLLQHWLYGVDIGRLGYKSDVAAMRTFDHVLVPIHKMVTR
jgi:carbamoyl-phosphate synthase large subunit